MELPHERFSLCSSLAAMHTPINRLWEPPMCQEGYSPQLGWHLLKEAFPDYSGDTAPSLTLSSHFLMYFFSKRLPDWYQMYCVFVCLSPPPKRELHIFSIFSRISASPPQWALKQSLGHNIHSITGCWMNASINDNSYTRRRMITDDQLPCGHRSKLLASHTKAPDVPQIPASILAPTHFLTRHSHNDLFKT